MLASVLSLGCLLCADGLVGGHELLKEAATVVVVVVCKAQHVSSTALSYIQDCAVKQLCIVSTIQNSASHLAPVNRRCSLGQSASDKP